MSGGQPDRSARIRGAVLGALVGDALGVPVEFKERAERVEDPVTGMRGYGTWNQPPGTWSDDGSLLLCSLEGLQEGFDPERVGKLFVRWRRDGYWSAHGNVFDVGVTTAKAISRLASGVAAEEAGPHDEVSNGNGSLMRILPVALRFADAPPFALAEYAMRLSRLTHAHARSQLACAFYCLLAVALLRGLGPADALAEAGREFEPLLALHPAEHEEFSRLIAPDFANLDEASIRSKGYVMDTLEAAIWCLLRHPDYSSTVLAAVNLGGDTDTTGCVAGGLAGLTYGESAIPLEWRDALPGRERLESFLPGPPA